MSELKPLQSEAYDKGKKPPLVDGQKEELDIGRVVVIAAHHTDSPEPPNAVAMSIMLELQQPNTVFQQIRNTLFIAHESSVKGNFVFRAINADVPRNYIENSKVFIYWMKKHGAKQLATEFKGTKIFRMIQEIARDMQNKPESPVDFRAYRKGDDMFLVNIILAEG